MLDDKLHGKLTKVAYTVEYYDWLIYLSHLRSPKCPLLIVPRTVQISKIIG